MYLLQSSPEDYENAILRYQGYIKPHFHGLLKVEIKNKRNVKIKVRTGDILGYLILTPFIG